jgi:hypothetical protein
LYANLHFRYTQYPLTLGAEFIWDLRIKALDLSVFVRKSALQVHTVPTHPGAEFIWDLRIKALDLSVFVRKSALQVQCTHSPWRQSSYGT